MQYTQTPIFQKVYILSIEIYKTVANFPKAHKYSLGERLKNICNDLIELVIEANATSKKFVVISKLDVKLEVLRIYIRMAYDLRVISAGKYEKLNREMQNIGVQIGGWKKWAKN